MIVQVIAFLTMPPVLGGRKKLTRRIVSPMARENDTYISASSKSGLPKKTAALIMPETWPTVSAIARNSDRQTATVALYVQVEIKRLTIK